MRTVYSNSERSEQFLKQNAFLTCSQRFLKSNIWEKFKFKSEKIIVIQKLQEKFENKFRLFFFRKNENKVQLSEKDTKIWRNLPQGSDVAR